MAITPEDVITWGSNEYGQCGHGDKSETTWVKPRSIKMLHEQMVTQVGGEWVDGCCPQDRGMPLVQPGMRARCVGACKCCAAGVVTLAGGNTFDMSNCKLPALAVARADSLPPQSPPRRSSVAGTTRSV